MKTTHYTIIAERYADALFKLANERQTLDAVAADLENLRIVLKQDHALARWFARPLVSTEARREALRIIAEKLQLHAITQHFLALVAKKTRLSLLPLIIDAFRAELRQARGEMSGEIISAQKLSDAQCAQAEQALAAHYGKRVFLESRQDASLLGGMMIRIGGMTIDSTLKGKLDRLRQELKAA